MATSTEKIDEIAIKYNKTKKQYYKDLWYKKVKEFVDEFDIINKRTLSSSRGNNRDDDRYRVIK